MKLGINCTYCSAVICCCSLRCAARRASIVVIWWASCSTAPIRLAWVRSGAAEVGWIPVEGRKHVEVCLRKSILMSILTQEATESLGKFVPGVDGLSNLLYRYQWSALHCILNFRSRKCFPRSSHVVAPPSPWQLYTTAFGMYKLFCFKKRIRFSFPSPASIGPTGYWLQKRAGVFPCACGALPRTAWRAAPDEHAGTAGVRSPGWEGSEKNGRREGDDCRVITFIKKDYLVSQARPTSASGSGLWDYSAPNVYEKENKEWRHDCVTSW